MKTAISDPTVAPVALEFDPISSTATFSGEEFASPLSLAAIASAVGVHPVHLARQFRASQGCTIGEYIRRVRG